MTTGAVTIGTYGATDATGWSTITPHITLADEATQRLQGAAYVGIGTRFVYFDPEAALTGVGTEASPYNFSQWTTAKAAVRASRPDWMVFKAGSTFLDTVDNNTMLFNLAGKVGVDVNNPLVFTSYGSGARPVIAINSPTAGQDKTFFGIASGSYAVFKGLDFYGYRRDPESVLGAGFTTNPVILEGGPSGINGVTITNFILVEDCRMRWLHGQTFGNSNLTSKSKCVIIRRNVYHDFYGVQIGPGFGYNRGQPFFITNFAADGAYILAEENFFYHNGWNSDLYKAYSNASYRVAPRNDQDHSMYITNAGTHATAAGNVAPTIRGNISIMPSANFLRDAGGGFMYDNLQMGGTNFTALADANAFVRNLTPPPYEMSNNIVLHQLDISQPQNGEWPTGYPGKGNGFGFAQCDGSFCKSNIVAHNLSEYNQAQLAASGPYAFNTWADTDNLPANNCTLTNNITYKHLLHATPAANGGLYTGTSTGTIASGNVYSTSNTQGYTNPEITASAYGATLPGAPAFGGGTPNLDAMMWIGEQGSANLSSANWDQAYLGTWVTTIRAGFNLSRAATPPYMFTTPAGVTPTTDATLQGKLYSPGGKVLTEYGFVYGTSANPTIGGGGVTKVVATPVLGDSRFSADITGLSGGTTYHFRAYGTNADGTGYGADESFSTTGGVAPSVTTLAVEAVRKLRATFNGDVDSDAGSAITERGFVYATHSEPTVSDTKIVVSGTDLNPYTYTVLNLAANTAYVVRAYAINANGTAYGSDVNFTTLTTNKTQIRLAIRR